MMPGARFEELTWVTSAERCVGTYSVVVLRVSDVKKASRPCLARCYLVNIGSESTTILRFERVIQGGGGYVPLREA